MKIKLISKLNFFLFILLVCFSFFACEEPEIIGLEHVEGDKLNIFTNDTTTLVSYSIFEDSIQTDETTLSLLGICNDPVFGETKASFYTQLRLSTNKVNFGNNPILDSLVLTLAYKSYYGDTSSSLTVKVFEINESIYKDSLYYSTRNISCNSTELASKTFTPKLDSVTVYGEKLAPHLRIKLDNTNFGQSIIDASGTTSLNDNTNFLQFIKGLYVTAESISGSSNGIIFYFDMMSSLSRMTLYYHNADDDSLQFNFVINEQCARFNNFAHNYTSANIDTTKGDSILYLQPMGGLKTKIIFPYIRSWFNYTGKIAINKAELIIKVNENTSNTAEYTPPSKLALVKLNSEGKNAFLPDNYENYFGGSYDKTKKEYKFIISRHIQQLLNNEIIDYGLYLMVAGSAINANRVIINGSKLSSDRLRLKLTYTKLY